jgi:rubrerythrin
MEELTVEEIIKYAMRIERESYGFYRKASKFLEGSGLEGLTRTLAEEEVGHLNQLRSLIEQERIAQEDLADQVDIDTSLFTRIISTQDIPSMATARDVLYIALEREKDTRANYEMLLGIAAFNEEIRSTLRMLKKMEEEHMRMLRERIDALKAGS